MVRYPNFLFIGPDKSGSTWLYEALKHHRQVFLPGVKELFFFDQFYDRGWSWYSSYFRNAGEQHRVVGEICHDYLFSPLACQRIAHDLPNVKLMVCLREPVQRAFSEYLYRFKVGDLACEFETALEEADELIDHGRYAKYLNHYLRVFRREQILVAVFDDLAANPQQFFDTLCDFLGIPRAELSGSSKERILPAAKPRFRRMARFAREVSWKLRRLGFPGVVGKIKGSSLLQRFLYSPYRSEEKPQMSPATREYLRSIFSPEVQRLDALLGTNFAARWGYAEVREGISATPREQVIAVQATPQAGGFKIRRA